MGFNFPPAPTVGATYSSGGVTYTWNGYGWVGSGYGDAPIDSKTYGRKDAAWSEAATKGYADTQDALKVAKAGDVLSGYLTLHADPDAAMKASTKQYVDNKVAAVPVPDISGKVSKSGDSMSGGLTLNGGLSVNAVQFYQQPASVYQGSSGGLQINANGSAAYDAFISYHRPGGGYAANMGLMNDQRFGFGGWSVGAGVQYRFWSREDFSEAPVHNTRLVYVGDYVHSSDEGLTEPYGATACQTGGSGANWSGYPNGSYLTQRYRALQVRRSDGYYGSEAA